MHMGEIRKQGAELGSSDRAYEEKLIEQWSCRTGMSGSLLRHLLSGAKVAARGGVRVDRRVLVSRGEVEAWLEQLVTCMQQTGGLGIREVSHQVGSIGANFDARIKVVLDRTRFGNEASEDRALARIEGLMEQFCVAAFLAYGPGITGEARDRTYALAQRLAGEEASCQQIENQLHHLIAMSYRWLDESFDAIVAEV